MAALESYRLPFGDDSLIDRYPSAPLLSAEDERQLVHALAHGSLDEQQAARERFVTSNVRLVISIARRYQGHEMSLLDLIQEGHIGLLRAIEKYDGRGRFTTYATCWIRQAISRALMEKGRTIRLPVHMHEQLYQLRVAEQDHRATTGRRPTDEELAEALNVSRAKVEHLLAIRSTFDDGCDSLDRTFGEDDDLDGHRILSAPNDTAHEAIDAVDRAGVRQLLTVLPERERLVLVLRYGFDRAGEARTLHEVAEALDPPITRERVRQIERDALKALREVITEKEPTCTNL